MAAIGTAIRAFNVAIGKFLWLPLALLAAEAAPTSVITTGGHESGAQPEL